MKKLATFINGVLAGVSIALGGTVFLCVENKVMGAALFTLGLFLVLTHGFYLYTGKVCYVFEKDKAYALDLIWIWLGNLAGTVLVGLLISSTRLSTVIPELGGLAEKAAAVAQTKLNDNLWSIFVLAIFCNVMIYIAVDGYNNNPHQLGKYLAVFFGVMAFIICGFEHCVANMFYFTAGWAWSGKAVLYLLVMTLGNAVGGVALPLLKKLRSRLES